MHLHPSMRTKILYWVLTFLLIFGFQNCGQYAVSSHESDIYAGPEKVIASTAAFDQINFETVIYSSASHFTVPSPNRLSLDLQAGEMELKVDANAPVQCAIDGPRLNSLRNLLAQSQVCEPGDLPNGTPVCMAIGISDIELSNSSAERIHLRSVICNNGVYLCNGNDAVLRTMLADLRDHPPVECQ